MKYRVGDLRFVRKEDVDLYTIDLRNRYKPNLRVVGADVDFLKALLTSHPESSQKFSKPIEGFSVGTNRHGTWSIFIEYQDGSRDDFSFKKCITGLRSATDLHG